MSIRKMIWLLSIVFFVAVTTSWAGEPVVDCKVSRITVPLAEKNGKVTCAASFMYGAYVENFKDPDDFLNSDDLMKKFNNLSEEERWQYPEYIIIKNFQAWKAGNKEEAISYYEPGYSQDRERVLQTQSTEKIQSIMKPFTRILFLYKNYFGPYVRISWIMSEVSASGSTKGMRGIPGYSYFKRVGNRYMLTNEIYMTHLFDAIVRTYGARKFLKKENISLNPNTKDMDWFALDVDVNSPPENKENLKVFSTEGISKIPQSFSENYLKVYVKCVPINIKMEAGKQQEGLTEETQFFESAVTKYELGTDTDILQLWSEKSKEGVKEEIERKNSSKWPDQKISPFSETPTVLFSMPTSSGDVVYYKKKLFFLPGNVDTTELIKKQAANPIYYVGLKKEEGNYRLFNPDSEAEFNIFTNKMFIDAVNSLDGPK